MALKWKHRLWLRMFHKVTSGRASVEECNEFGISETLRKEFYDARYARRNDAMKKLIVTKVPLSNFFEKQGDDPMDAMIRAIDRKRKQ